MIPAQLLAIAAPIVAEKIADRFKSTASTQTDAHAQTPPPTGGDDILEQIMSHEKSKASIRPAMMLATGRLSIWSAVMAAVAAALHAIGPNFSLEIEREAAEFVVNTLLIIAAGGGTAYGYKHTVRSVDKAKGTA